MKTKLFLSIFISLLFAISCSQTKVNDSRFNLSFENIQNGKPQNWYVTAQPGYSVSLDSVNVKSGQYSILIESMGDSVDIQSIRLILPNNYEGKIITLSGYIKTENVTDGYAGLGMQIDPQIAFNNMSQNGVTGTTDWKKYEISLPMRPAQTQQIIIGGLLVGKGKMWLDNLNITIDGKDIRDTKIFERKRTPAEKDKEFDTGSNIIFPKLNEQKINDLELLGRLWGFLKYHHPAIAIGNYNWDYELFRIFPEYLKATGIAQRDEILLRWIKKYGKISKKPWDETPSDAFLKPDLTWIDSSNMNPKLKEKVKEIYRNRYQDEHFYIEMVENVGNPTFLHENSYSNMLLPDTGFRLLALYRYWNMIQYFYPNKYLTDKNWNDVLKDYIPKFILAGTQLEYELAALKLIGELDDTHANLWGGRDKIDSLRGNWLAPVQVRFIENKLVVTDYYNRELQNTTGLKVGDIITYINGKSVKSIVDSVKEYYPASNEAARMRDIANDMLRSSNPTIQINYISSNQSKRKDLNLYDRQNITQSLYKKDTMLCYKLLNNNIGYITLKSIRAEDIDKIKSDFKNTKGIIIDIRNYPSYFVPFLLGSYFVSTNTPFVKFTNGNPNNSGEFTFTPSLEIPKPEETYQGKLVVIVNEDTQSQAEYTAMAFRAGDNTTIIGSQTAGADGNVSQIVLPGDMETWISGIGVYYPDGRETQRIGIVPDIVVKPTIKGIREGRDELLEKAIEIIKQEKNDCLSKPAAQ
jgi:C-terminal processing protease CtpA/Prc